jgi:asparagine synthase (glutamine-hydrolysing)
MSAICGLLVFEKKTQVKQVKNECIRMMAALKHFGPDNEGFWSADDAAIGRQLMCTVPENEHDKQPIVAANGRFVVVADALLTNRSDLANDLGIAGREMTDISDAMLAARALERWGENAFVHLYGAFAIAAYDRRERRLLLARDPTMQKPLFYHYGNGMAAFASMPAGLHALSEVPCRPNEHLVTAFLSGTVDPKSDESFFLGINRLLPGHVYIISSQGIRTERFWQPSTTPLRFKTHDDYVAALRQHLDRAVATSLRGTNGKVSTELSSGLDSSAVTATAARLMAPAGGEVFAFTAVPEEGLVLKPRKGILNDEGPLARATAAYYPNIHHVLVKGTRSALETLDRNYFVYQSPIPNLCNLGWAENILNSAQEQGLTVHLTGIKGNFAFSQDGFTLFPEYFSKGRIAAWWQTVRRARARGVCGYRVAILETFGPWLPGSLWQLLSKKTRNQGFPSQRYSALKEGTWLQLQKEAKKNHLPYDGWWRPEKNHIQFILDMFLNLRCDCAVADKGILGQWHIDVRNPLGDRRLVEFMLCVPTEQIFYDSGPRALARHAVADRLPDVALNNCKYGLQGADWFVPVSHMRERISAEVDRMEAFEPTRQLFDTERLRKLVENWPTDWQTDEVHADYRRALLSAISFSDFIRRAYGAN